MAESFRVTRAHKSATAVLIRPPRVEGREIEVFLTRRPKTMRNWADSWVFPGGTMDSGDRTSRIVNRCQGISVQTANDIMDAVASLPYSINVYRYRRELHDRILARNGRIPTDPVPDWEYPIDQLASWVTVIREVFEETGYLLVTNEYGFPLKDVSKVIQRYRKPMLNGEISFITVLEENGLYIPVESVYYIGRLITPSFKKRRFDNQFFLITVPRDTELTPSKDETAESAWFPLNQALALSETDHRIWIPQTVFILRTLSLLGDIVSICRAFSRETVLKNSGRL